MAECQAERRGKAKERNHQRGEDEGPDFKHRKLAFVPTSDVHDDQKSSLHMLKRLRFGARPQIGAPTTMPPNTADVMSDSYRIAAPNNLYKTGLIRGEPPLTAPKTAQNAFSQGSGQDFGHVGEESDLRNSLNSPHL